MSLAKIGNKIFSGDVELSKEEVDLASVGDINKKASNYLNESNKTVKLLSQYEKIEGDLSSGYKALYKDSRDLLSEMVDFESKAKELGIKPESIGDYKKAKDKLKEAESNRMKVDRVLNK